jgi:hypothetical protein
MPVEERRRIRKPQTNVPRLPLKWSIERASREFKLAQNSLRRRLNENDAEPDEGGCYTTMQIVDAIFAVSV